MLARSNYMIAYHKIYKYINWIIATHLTEQPPAASLSHRFRIPLPAPRDSHLCVVKAWGLKEHQITPNKIYAFLAFIWTIRFVWQMENRDCLGI